MFHKEVFALILLLWYLCLVNAFGREANNDAKLAAIHLSRITREAKCKKPVPRVVHIEELNPNARKKYLPHCTILHFCGQESGCCRQENEVCAPKSSEEVNLYFWVVELTPLGKRKGVEKMTFLNHTECDCIPANINNSRELKPGFLRGAKEQNIRHPLLAKDGDDEESISDQKILFYSFRGKNLYNFNIYHFPISHRLVMQ